MRIVVTLVLFATSTPTYTIGFVLPFAAVVAAQSTVCPSSVTLSSSTSSNSATSSATMPTQHWFQKKIIVTAPSRGCHLITNDIMKAVGSDMRNIDVGLCNLFVQHTSASLTINENADPDVRTDLEIRNC